MLLSMLLHTEHRRLCHEITSLKYICVGRFYAFSSADRNVPIRDGRRGFPYPCLLHLLGRMIGRANCAGGARQQRNAGMRSAWSGRRARIMHQRNLAGTLLGAENQFAFDLPSESIVVARSAQVACKAEAVN